MQSDAVTIKKHYRVEEDPYLLRRSRVWRANLVDFEGGQYIGRTPFRWVILLLFFTCIYVTVALLWTFCYLIFAYYLPTKTPRHFLQQPGLSMEPSLFTSRIPEIRYFLNIYGDTDKIIDHISQQHDRYGEPKADYFMNCSAGNSYGYHTTKPCIFLKVNKILRFTPETYDTLKEMPANMPNDLLNYIKNLTVEQRKHKVWLGCETKPFLKLEYIPHPYVDASSLIYNTAVRYYAIRAHGAEGNHAQKVFFNSQDFNRVIAIRPIENLEWNKAYKVQCYAFAKNIIIDADPMMPLGFIRFIIELMHTESYRRSHDFL